MESKKSGIASTQMNQLSTLHFTKGLKNKIDIVTLGPILGLVAITIIFSIIAPNFFSLENIPNIYDKFLLLA